MSKAEQAIDPQKFREVMATWPTGVSIITSMSDENRPVGILCNSLTSISLAKKLLLWTVDHSSGSYAHWEKAGKWAVHFLADNQQELVDRFARKGVPDKFAGLDYQLSEFGNPILNGAVARLECRTTERYETFDHTIVLGEVIAMNSTGHSPMIFAYSKFHKGPKRPS
jgi:3-hydroxy-9,10-secoandrosta-1,3,5(10)-triene-9,17-dione monooxygenase reductase component